MMILTGPHATADGESEQCISPAALGDEEASALAVACGARVEVLGARTETDTTWAEPDGSFTWEASTVPVRTDVSGVWEPVVPTLAPEENGTVAPVAAMFDVEFSGGGDGPLATVTTADGTYSVSAPWLLPEPVLDGRAATYADVLPGVDLVVTVDETGQSFSQVLVVEDELAAANPELASIEFPLDLSAGMELVTAAEGGVSLL